MTTTDHLQALTAQSIRAIGPGATAAVLRYIQALAALAEAGLDATTTTTPPGAEPLADDALSALASIVLAAATDAAARTLMPPSYDPDATVTLRADEAAWLARAVLAHYPPPARRSWRDTAQGGGQP